MQASVVEQQPGHFVGLRLVAPVDQVVDAQNQTRQTLLRRQFELSAILDPDIQIGVTLPNETEAQEDIVTSYLGFHVSQYKDVPSDMVAIELPGGRYAQCIYKGPLDCEEYENFYPAVAAWLEQQQLTPSNRNPWIEVYGRHNDWSNRSNPQNEVMALIPLGGPSFR